MEEKYNKRSAMPYNVSLIKISCLPAYVAAIIILVNVFFSGIYIAGCAEKPEAELAHQAEESLKVDTHPQYKFEYFNDFIIYVCGEKGKVGVLLCDIVLEINYGMKLSDDRGDLRKLLYRTLKSLDQENDSRNLKKQLRKNIKVAINAAMGQKVVKEVNFVKFILL
ncbi:MAG TPA: hypothetical protein VMZ04_09085 [Anaerolineae bacterium]|nr:hypothetical protein [Anaerolineae bacterium]